MNDKEKYLELMQRYYEAETTPEEERELTSYAASTDDPDFEGLRGVLGFLSIGRQKKARRGRTIRLYAYAAAASVAILTAVGIGLTGRRTLDENCIRYAYGEKVDDDAQIMAAVESSLTDFFGTDPAAEQNLKELFNR